MAILLVCVAVVVLVALDLTKRIELGHPVWVLLTAAGYFCSVLWTAALAFLALAQAVSGANSLLAWGQAALAALPGTLFGLYVLIKANFFPLARRPGASRVQKAARLLDDGLFLGLPLQLLLVGGYAYAALSLHGAFQGPLWMLPFYPLVLAVLWPMLHLVFHVAIVAIVLDPLILLAAFLIGVLWTVQEIFLLHGLIRGCLVTKKSPGMLVLHILLGLVPVVNLILALRLRWKLRAAAREEAFV